MTHKFKFFKLIIFFFKFCFFFLVFRFIFKHLPIFNIIITPSLNQTHLSKKLKKKNHTNKKKNHHFKKTIKNKHKSEFRNDNERTAKKNLF